MQQLDVSRVAPDEIDSLGHLNVRCYFARIDRASGNLLAALGLTAEELDANRAMVRRIDTYSRFRREQFEGAELTVHGGTLASIDDQIRCYFEIHNLPRNEVAASFITSNILSEATSRRPLDMSSARQRASERQSVQIPQQALPRSLSLERPRLDIPFEQLVSDVDEWTRTGMTGHTEGQIEVEDCAPDGFARDIGELLFVLFRRRETRDAKPFDPPVLYTDEGHRFGWVVQESRSVELGSPRLGDTIVCVSADVAIHEKSRQLRRWAFVKKTGELVSVYDSVGIAVDLDARRAIAIPTSIRSTMDRHFVPQYL